MDLAQPQQQQQTPVQQFVSVRQRGRRKIPLEVIAVTDPNDLLSYPVRLQDLEGDNLERVRVGNVFLGNTRSWFGLFAPPIAAHTGYFENERLVKLLLDGNDKRARTCLKTEDPKP